MKTICIILGTISLGLGILGIFLPLLPTTPFLLLTAALYFKGSPRLYQWLLNHKYFGTYIRNFRENKAIPLRAKIISLLLMWGTMLYCIFFLIPLVWVKILLFLIAAGVTYDILSFKTLKKRDKPARASSKRSSQCFTEFCPITSETYLTEIKGISLALHTKACA